MFGSLMNSRGGKRAFSNWSRVTDTSGGRLRYYKSAKTSNIDTEFKSRLCLLGIVAL